MFHTVIRNCLTSLIGYDFSKRLITKEIKSKSSGKKRKKKTIFFFLFSSHFKHKIHCLSCSGATVLGPETIFMAGLNGKQTSLTLKAGRPGNDLQKQTVVPTCLNNFKDLADNS